MIFAQIAPEQVNPAQISPIGAVLPLILILFVLLPSYYAATKETESA